MIALRNDGRWLIFYSEFLTCLLSVLETLSWLRREDAYASESCSIEFPLPFRTPTWQWKFHPFTWFVPLKKYGGCSIAMFDCHYIDIYIYVLNAHVYNIYIYIYKRMFPIQKLLVEHCKFIRWDSNQFYFWESVCQPNWQAEYFPLLIIMCLNLRYRSLNLWYLMSARD